MALNEKVKAFSEKVWAINSLVSKDDFVKAFETLMKVVVKVEENQVKRINDKLSGAQETIEKMSEEQKASFLSRMKEIADMVRDHKEKMERMKKGHAEDMSAFKEKMEEKMTQLHDNFHNEMPDVARILEEHMTKIPKPLEPDTADDIRNKLEVLPDGEKLKIDAIENLRKELEELRRIRTGRLGGGTSTIGVQAALGRIQVIEEEVSFSGTTGTLTETPASGTLKLFRGGVRMQEGTGKDYTISGNTITLEIAAVEGEIFVSDYERA